MNQPKKLTKKSIGSNIVWQIFGLPFALLWFVLGIAAYLGVIASLPFAIYQIYESDTYSLYEIIYMIVLASYFTFFGPFLGSQCMKIAKFILWPFGRDIKTQLLNKPRILIGNLLWHISGRFLITFLYLIFGESAPVLNSLYFHVLGMPFLVALHLFVGFVFYVTIVFIPFGKQLFKVVQLCFLPFGAQVFMPSRKSEKEAVKEEDKDQETL